MAELQRLRLDHASALLAFERSNRTYFAASVPDRGDAYFEDFSARLAALLAEQASGLCQYHVLVEGDGEIVGRVNLVDVADGSAELGYRIAEKAAGQGLATTAVHAVQALATSYGLVSLRAGTTHDNPASRKVLTRTGFVPVAETTFGDRPGTLYRLDLPDSGAVSARSRKTE